VEFTFPAMSLGPGQRVVVARNRDAFVHRYGDNILVAGEYGGTIDDFRLSNAGEPLRLEIATGDLIQEFTYDDDWVPATDGIGASLTIRDPRGELNLWNIAAGWHSSRRQEGSPGTADTDNGDFNLDGQLNVADVDLLCAGLRAADRRFDLTGDGSTNHDDLAFLIQNILGTSFGDTNLDGQFELSDLTSAFQSAEFEDQVVGNSSWADGDWNCDGDFLTSDLVLAFQSGRFVAAAELAGVPAARASSTVADTARAWLPQRFEDNASSSETSKTRSRWRTITFPTPRHPTMY
jgi:hypothetical protein